MNITQKSLLAIYSMVLLSVSTVYSQSTSLDALQNVIKSELGTIFSHNPAIKSYKVYSVKVDDVQEKGDLYVATGSFKFEDNTGKVSTNIGFEATVKKILNELTVPAIMVNFDDVVNSWNISQMLAATVYDSSTPLSLDNIKSKLRERLLVKSDVTSVQNISITYHKEHSDFVEIKGDIKYKDENYKVQTYSFSARAKAAGGDCIIYEFMKEAI